MPRPHDIAPLRQVEPAAVPANDGAARRWGRLLGVEDAAAYLGVSEGTFRSYVTVRPVHLGKRVLYDRLQLDRFADSLSGLRSGSGWADECELE